MNTFNDFKGPRNEYINYLKGYGLSVRRKLLNNVFTFNAPKSVLEKEWDKYSRIQDELVRIGADEVAKDLEV